MRRPTTRPTASFQFDLSQLASGGRWFAGRSFSVADIQMSFPLEAAASRSATDAKRHPRIADWLSRIHARPAYKRALSRGGPYGYAD